MRAIFLTPDGAEEYAYIEPGMLYPDAGMSVTIGHEQWYVRRVSARLIQYSTDPCRTLLPVYHLDKRL